MSRSVACSPLGTVGCLLTAAACADEEPTFRDRPLSAWVAVLTGDVQVKHRQGALIALSALGRSRSPRWCLPSSPRSRRRTRTRAVREAAALALGACTTG